MPCSGPTHEENVKVDFPGLLPSKSTRALSSAVLDPSLYHLRVGAGTEPPGFFNVQERNAFSPTRYAVLAGFSVIPISESKTSFFN